MSHSHTPSDDESTVIMTISEFQALSTDMKEILAKVTDLEKVTAVQNQRLSVLEKLMYGGVGLALTSIVIGLLALVVKVSRGP